ncbi:MAG: PDZ domain-containing protein [Nakamurella sp.]
MTWYSRLSQRGKVLLTGGVLGGVLVVAAAAIPVPYVALGPGVTYNTLGAVDGTQVISFSGKGIPSSAAEEIPGASHLNMTTISVTDGLPLFAALGLWANGDSALVPREDQFPPDKSVEQVNQQNAELFQESQSAAEIAALRYLKYPEVVYVGDIPTDSPSAGKLQPNDRITSFGGTAVTDRASLLKAILPTKPGQQVEVAVVRDGKPTSVQVTLGTRPDSGKQGYLGTLPTDRPIADFTISISLDRIGGPSAGLMFTLGIIDKLTAGDLASGHFIAGTGTINPDTADPTKPSVVGPIGGITLKLIAARDQGAQFFLVPAANCSEAITDIPAGLTLVKVSTVDDAMTALQQIAAGTPTTGC